MVSIRASSFVVMALAAASGCASVVGITDLDSTEKADASSSSSGGPSDAGSDGAQGDVVVDAGIDVGTDSNVDTGPSFRRVFVTSGPFRSDGNVGGVAGANGKCSAAAGSRGLGGTWLAWISGDGMDAYDRIGWNGEYRLMDGTTQVVANKMQLKSGTLTHAIDRNENNEATTGTADEARVWTGTSSNGNITSNICGNWTNNISTIGTYGRLSSTGTAWTAENGTSCSAVMRFYCFEQ